MGSRAACTISVAKYMAGAMAQIAPRGMSPLQVPQCPWKPHHKSPVSNPCSQESSLHPRPASCMPWGRVCWEPICISLSLPLGFSGGSDGKESACNVGDLGSIPGGGHGNPLQYSCLENLHGQRSLAGCSPWGCKESDTTERPSTAQA